MTLWTASEAATATGGRADSDWQATGVSIDIRTVQPGDLFVALKAARGGHDAVAQALAKGAAAAVVTHRPDGVAADAPLLIVPEVQKALMDLGRAARAHSKAKVVAVTGSAGKSATREMLRTVLSGQGRTHATEAGNNDRWGVALTLARMPRDADFAVIEIGAGQPGDIAPLARLVKPHVAMITTVAAAHLDPFGSLEAIAREKASIFEGLEPGGAAVTNGDLDTAPILEAAARARGARLFTFGQAPRNHHRLTQVRLVDDVTVATGRRWRSPVLYKVMAAGRHFAVKAMGVLAVVQALRLDATMAASDLARWQPPAGWGRRERILFDPVIEEQAIELIDDAFNADPASMAAALEVLAAAHPTDGVGRVSKGRRVAVLGDMLNLGPDESGMHEALADLPFLADIDVIHCVGPRMNRLWAKLPPQKRGDWVETAGKLVERAHRLIDAGDVLLVKGSSGSKVSKVVDAIRKLGHAAPQSEQGA